MSAKDPNHNPESGQELNPVASHSSTHPLIHSSKTSPHEILLKYFGYAAFRPLQEDIINSVLEKKDTLALLPTGGGKSVCFQVPALAMEGVCIVVSPLIALMKDQVEQLQRRGIKAVSIFSGMHRREIDIVLDNCVHGDVKFLYVSPERLKTGIFLARLKKMKVCLLAVDEAHCISQWGYDFRPPYLQIAEIRALQPEIPVIALTATATGEVKKDICEKLQFKSGYQVFQQSFARKNLSYSCIETENKPARLLQILQNVPGTAIVYVRSRNRTALVAQWLQKQRLQAAHYHAGLSPEQRNETQNNWIKNKVRIIVATNAFGMGIDKPDVRSVIHLDLPDNLEAYYQEAGRAGRDERYSYAVLLYGKNDLADIKDRIEQEHPPIAELKRVYQALANYYQLAVGSGELQTFPFSLEEFCDSYKMKPAEMHHALGKLETEGLIQLNQAYHAPSRLIFTTDKLALYEFQLANPKLDPLIKIILRMEGGEAFTNFIKISEAAIAKKLGITEEIVRQQLQFLHKASVLIYQAQTNKAQLVFAVARQDAERLPLNEKRLAHFKKLALQKADAVINYATHGLRCRTQLLLEYFGEISDKSCRICDFCIAKRKSENQEEIIQEEKLLMPIWEAGAILPKELLQFFQPKEHQRVLEGVKTLLDEGKLQYDEQGRLTMK